MDFNTIGKGSTFYILRETDETPVLEIGTVKEKTSKPMSMQYGVNNSAPLLDITVTVDGTDRVIPDLPVNIEIAQRGRETYTGSGECLFQAIDGMMARSKANLARAGYDQRVLEVGEQMKERINPGYAETKQQARTIKDLQARVDSQDKKLDQILGFMQDLNSSKKKPD
jgi:hypothetical protein